MCRFENIRLGNCPSNLKPILDRWCFNDTFSLFLLKDHVEKFRNFLNKLHENTKFTSKIEENASLLQLLDIKISCENNKFASWVYLKLTLGVIFTNFESFISGIYKHGLIESLLCRRLGLCFKYENFHQRNETLTSVFKDNIYPHNFVSRCIKKFLKNLFI